MRWVTAFRHNWPEGVRELDTKFSKFYTRMTGLRRSGHGKARWCSGLTYWPVTPEIVGSNPIRVANPPSPRCFAAPHVFGFDLVTPATVYSTMEGETHPASTSMSYFGF